MRQAEAELPREGLREAGRKPEAGYREGKTGTGKVQARAVTAGESGRQPPAGPAIGAVILCLGACQPASRWPLGLKGTGGQPLATLTS